jgi:hypothetical protein
MVAAGSPRVQGRTRAFTPARDPYYNDRQAMPSEPPPRRGPDGPLFSPLLEEAIRLAARGHYRQFRKQDGADESLPDDGPLPPERVPYVTHLMGTAAILARLGACDEVLAAAFLHDYLEDVPDPDGRESIRSATSDAVLRLVEEVTEDKRGHLGASATWETRKREQIERIDAMPVEAVLIKVADLLHNLISLRSDLEASAGTAVWERLNAPPERQLWYFSSVLAAAEGRLGDHPLVRQLRSAIGAVAALAGER